VRVHPTFLKWLGEILLVNVIVIQESYQNCKIIMPIC
jgi:hypothetical protein